MSANDNSRACFVYMMSMGYADIEEKNQFLKVGISSAPYGRLYGFQTANPFPLRLLDTWRFPTRDDALWVERKFHEENHERKCKGEWFVGNSYGAADAILMLAGRCWIERRGGDEEGLEVWLKAMGLNEDIEIPYVCGEAPFFGRASA